MPTGTPITLDLTSVRTTAEFIDVCARAIGREVESTFDLEALFELAEAYDTAAHPLDITVVGIDQLSVAIPRLALYLGAQLQAIVRDHETEGTLVRFV